MLVTPGVAALTKDNTAEGTEMAGGAVRTLVLISGGIDSAACAALFLASAALDDGRAEATLERLVKVSNET
jgi:NH3-dependent NAD+ synthetase